MFSRRSFITVSLATLTAPSLPSRRALARNSRFAPRPRQFADVPLKSTRLRKGVLAITERGGNSMLIITTDGPILVDTKITQAGQMLLDESKKGAGGAAPEVIINTHHHFDHTGGNPAFDDAAEIIAHKNLNPRIQTHLDERIKPALATEINALRNSGKTKQADELAAAAAELTVDDFKADREYDDTLEIDRGGVKVVLRHFGNGHTDNDTVVFLPELNVLATGDLFFNNMHPFIDRPAGATTVGWRRNVRKVMDLCDDQTIVVPGHGEMADRAGLVKQIDYFDQLQAIVEKAIRDGKSKDTVAAMAPDQFTDLGFEMLQAQALTAMYEELSEGVN